MNMRLLLPWLIAAASPAMAQSGNHSPHQDHEVPAAQAKPHAAHAGGTDQTSHGRHAPPSADTQPAAHHRPGAATSDESDPHAGHRTQPAESANQPAISDPPAEALSGPAHAADLVFDAEAMAQARDELRSMHGGLKISKVLVDRLEARLGRGRDAYVWDAQFWHGGDIDKFWLKSEGEAEFAAGLENAELQALWSHAIDPWFDLQVGLRQDMRRGDDRTHAVIGIQGLAPYWFEVDAALFLSQRGELTARLEGEYDLRIAQRLILQPRMEIDLAAQDVPELGMGSGLSTAELGARFRFEILPEFAPYIGIGYERSFGGTRRFRRLKGEDRGGWALVAGVRAWF